MTNILEKRKCKEENCGKKRPAYNYEGEKGLYCAIHKKEGMINVICKTCKEKDCKNQPTYNYEGKKAVYCDKHKNEEMIDVKNKRCEEKECKTRPSHNYEGKKAVYCEIHKKDGMINVVSKRCEEKECKIIPIYNYEGEKRGLYCSIHKKEGMIDVINRNKRCKTPLCETRASNTKYRGYCFYCFIHVFPDEPVTRNYRTKEKSIFDSIQNRFLKEKWTSNKTISGGCSYRRPDVHTDKGTHFLTIEVDENQHREYDESCENKRKAQLWQDVGYMNMVVIRFNPDSYINKEGKKIKSCWSLNKQGICVIQKKKEEEWQKRLELLFEKIEYYLHHIPEKSIETVELFYDEIEVDDEIEIDE